MSEKGVGEDSQQELNRSSHIIHFALNFQTPSTGC